MSSKPIIMRWKGTGSAIPNEPLASPRACVPVKSYLNQQLRKNPSPWRAIDMGIPAFRDLSWNTTSTSPVLERFDILDPEDGKWYDFSQWWADRYPDDTTGYEETRRGVESALIRFLDSGIPQRYCVCLPVVGGNVILHGRDTPFLIDNNPRLYVFKEWFGFAFSIPMTVNVYWANDTIRVIGNNAISLFWERPSPGIGTTYTTDIRTTSGSAAMFGSLPSSDTWGRNSMHPWPEYDSPSYSDPYISGFVPVCNPPGHFDAVLPISYNSSELNYLVSLSGLAGMGVFDIRKSGDFYCEPYAVWNNVNPQNPTAVTRERTTLDISPIPSSAGEGGNYLRPGRYVDSRGVTQLIRLGSYSEETEEYETIPSMYTCGEMVDSWGPGYGETGPKAVPVEMGSELDTIKLFKRYRESCRGEEDSGLIVAIDIYTGQGGMNYPTEVYFRFRVDSQRYEYPVPEIIPMSDSPEVAEVTVEDMYLAGDFMWRMYVVRVQFSDLLDKDPFGYYYSDQRLKLRYKIAANMYGAMTNIYPGTLKEGPYSPDTDFRDPPQNLTYVGYELASAT